jgi:hypothetical protein
VLVALAAASQLEALAAAGSPARQLQGMTLLLLLPIVRLTVVMLQRVIEVMMVALS